MANKENENKEIDNKEIENKEIVDKDIANNDLDDKGKDSKDIKAEDEVKKVVDDEVSGKKDDENFVVEIIDVNDGADKKESDTKVLDAKKGSKEKKWTAFDIGQIVVIVLLLFVCLFGTYKLYQNLTAVRFTKALALAQNYQSNGDYASAIKYYQQAISIDSKSAVAYEELANCYATLGDTEHVMNVLYSGWQNIGDQTMLDNYISLKLNSVIASIQTSGGSFEAVKNVLDVLKIDGTNENALQLLGTLYSYCMIDKNSSGDSVLFWESEEENTIFSQYLEAVSTMLDIYEVSPSDELEMLIARYIMPEGNVVWIGLNNCSDYALLVQDASDLLGESSSLSSYEGCLEEAANVSGVFTKLWTKVSEDDVDAFRDFMISDKLLAFKDALVAGEYPYLELEMENTFCQEGVILTLEDNSWTYHFPDFSENLSTKGVITLQLTYDEVQAAEQAIEEAKENGTLENTEETVESQEDATVDSSDESSENSSEESSQDEANLDDASKDTETDDAADTSDSAAEASTEEEIKSGKVIMNYEPAVHGTSYFPHTTYYFVCEYEGDVVTYKYQQVITLEDGTKTRTTIDNWGDEELETVVDEDLEEEPETEETPAPTQTQPQETNTQTTPDVIVDPETGAMYDPNTGLQIDPATGFLIDPATGLYIDPNTWTYIDPATGAVVDPNAPATEETPADPNAAAAGA
jgi:tetratricopeptide (TPR) repeat protein